MATTTTNPNNMRLLKILKYVARTKAPSYGKISKRIKTDCSTYVTALVNWKFLERGTCEYPSLRVTKLGRECVRKGAVPMLLRDRPGRPTWQDDLMTDARLRAVRQARKPTMKTFALQGLVQEIAQVLRKD